MNWLYVASVAIGGAVGALLRVMISGIVTKTVPDASHFGTLAVNLVGCFLIGLTWSWFDKLQVSYATRLLVITGCLGAFTTFSTFGLESLHLFSSGQFKTAVGYVLVSNIFGIAFVMLGASVSKSFT